MSHKEIRCIIQSYGACHKPREMASVNKASAIMFIVCNAIMVYYLLAVVPTQTQHMPQLVLCIKFSILGTGILQVVMHFTGFGAAPTGKFATGPFSLATSLPIGLAWCTMEQPACLVPIVSLISFFGSGNGFHPGVVFLALFSMHYLQRSYIYPWLSRGRPYPVHAWACAMAFCASNATMQANELLYGPIAQAPLSALAEPHALLGYVLFVFGMAANIHSDYLLRSLRKPGEKVYRIPRGGLFEYVSGAHFVGEIIEWTGLAVATGFASAPTVFAVFNVMGIGTRAIASHEWSVAYFGDKYPKDRKRLIPMIW